MTGEQIKNLCRLYIARLEHEYPPERHDTTVPIIEFKRGLRHLHWMALEISKMVDEGHTDKAQRWVGFMQGTVWGLGVATIDELRRENMCTLDSEEQEIA